MDLKFAPIVFFAFNRPWHTREALTALSKNYLATESILYIYADGPKADADENSIRKIKETREVIKSGKWCKEVIVVERKGNLGLANSIIAGVNEIFSMHDRIIVLEDDIVPSKGFLKYMNDALDLFENDENVGCIHAWNYYLNTKGIKESTFFLKGGDCWGWATWKTSWNLFNSDGNFLLKLIKSRNLEFEFNRKGTFNYVEMLEEQIKGKNNSWAIRWHASLFLAEKYCLHPTMPIVKNIGLDNSGTHCLDEVIIQNPIDFIKINKIPVEESEWFFSSYQAMYGLSKKMLP